MQLLLGGVIACQSPFFVLATTSPHGACASILIAPPQQNPHRFASRPLPCRGYAEPSLGQSQSMTGASPEHRPGTHSFFVYTLIPTLSCPRSGCHPHRGSGS